MKIFISTTSFAKFSNKSIELLKNNGISFKLNKKGRKLNEKEIKVSLKNCDGVIAGTEKYSKDVIDSLPNLKIISRVGIGVDNIDLEAVTKKKISIFKSQTSPSRSVAELALGLLIDCSRQITYQDSCLKKKKWNKRVGNIISGKKLGVIGLGNIGKEFVKLTKGFDLDYYAYDKKKDQNFSKKHNVKYISLKKLFKVCDIVSIHLSYSKNNNNIIDRKYFSIAKKNLILINTSRGEVINEIDLIHALNKDQLSAIGLDVYNNEPYSGDLIKFQNAILTPHIGSYSKEIRSAMEYEATLNLVKFFKGQ